MYCIFIPEHSWNMWLPGFPNETRSKSSNGPITEAHKQRLNLIKKSKK